MEQITSPLEQILKVLPYVIPFILLHLILVVISLVDLIRREKTLGPKWIWYPLILFITIFGSAAYLIFGRKE